MSRDRRTARPGRVSSPVRAAGWLLFFGLLAAWWATFAPTYLGGPATYVLIEGHSMEPMLYSGDVAIARPQDSYQAGDLVVFDSELGFKVIHRLVKETPEGWTTKGDNHLRGDGWIVPEGAILGQVDVTIPNAAVPFAWWSDHPFGGAAIMAGLTLLAYVPTRRRRLDPVLLESLRGAVKEPRRDGRSTTEYLVLWVAVLACLASLWVVGAAWSGQVLLTAQGILPLSALVASFTGAWLVAYRLYDGLGVAEPSKSMYALSGRLHLVEAFPTFDDIKPARSAIALRKIAEKYRLPVLHHVDRESGQHSFLLITVQEGWFLWTPQVGGPQPTVPGPGADAGTHSDAPRGGVRRAREHAGMTMRDRAVIVTSIAAGALLAQQSAKHAAVASAAGVAVGLSVPKGHHAGPRQPRSWRVKLTMVWLTIAAVSWAVVTQWTWLQSNPDQSVLVVGALAAVVVGGLVMKFLPDEEPAPRFVQPAGRRRAIPAHR